MAWHFLRQIDSSGIYFSIVSKMIQYPNYKKNLLDYSKYILENALTYMKRIVRNILRLIGTYVHTCLKCYHQWKSYLSSLEAPKEQLLWTYVGTQGETKKSLCNIKRKKCIRIKNLYLFWPRQCSIAAQNWRHQPGK